jgi:hypothetical protein
MAKAAATPRKPPAKARTAKAGTSTPAQTEADKVAAKIDQALQGKLANVKGQKVQKKAAKVHNVAKDIQKDRENAKKHRESVKSAANTPESRGYDTLNARQRAFVDEYIVDMNATQAAIRAGYSQKTAGSVGHEILNKPEIAAAIAERQKDRLKRVELDQDRIVQELWNVVTADANDLVEYRRTCCRYCWGEDFLYQRTVGEMERARIQHQKDILDAREDANSPPIGPFDEAGGIGYDIRRPPHPDCAECFGQGVGSVFVKDTRDLPPAARSMYAGVKQTKDGLEIKMHDKQGSMQLLMRHAGMLNDKLRVHTEPEDPMALLLGQLAGKNFKPVA